ncbi:MAG: hypothetical protein FWD14_00055 [Treponema sp.]|nr:hypothetical protein [Treponema sp.]
MKKNIISILIILMLALSVCISCGSTGAVEDESANRAQEARQRAIDFESPAYFPSEWEALEAQFTAAESSDEYNAVAEAYDELFKKTIPLYAQAKEDEVMAIRSHLINSGFAGHFPEYLKNADDMALAALEQYKADDYYKARDTLSEAMAEYEILQMGAQVFLARQEIIDRGFAQFDAENFLRADEVAQTAIESFDAGNKEAAITSAEEALLRYNLVLANGWTAYAAVRRDAAMAERELALAERANIASRETFRNAESILATAEENFTAENFTVAGLSYVEAEVMYAISRKETEERRLRAEEAIRLAEEKIEESNEAAVEAERLIEGGVR